MFCTHVCISLKLQLSLHFAGGWWGEYPPGRLIIACSNAALWPGIGLFRFYEWGSPLQRMVWADFQGIISAEIMIRHEQKPGGYYLR